MKDTPKPKKNVDLSRYIMKFKRNSLLRAATVYLGYLNPPQNTKKENQSVEERQKSKEADRKKLNDFLAKIKEDGRDKILDFRIRGAERMTAKNAMSNLLVGKYRLTFTAEALNRQKVKEVFKEAGSKKNSKVNRDNWEGLLEKKAGMAITHGGINSSRRGALFPNTKPGKLLHFFEIEDNNKKVYTCEFEVTTPGSLSMEWVNGPYNSRLARLGLGKIGKQGSVGEKYALPCIRIYSDIVLEKIGELETPYFKVSESQDYKGKIKKLAELLSIKSDEFLGVYDSFGSLEPAERYKQTVKWLLMSQDQLYLKYSKNDSNSAARFVSYSLLKQPPSKEFKVKFAEFRNRKISADQFTDYIIRQDGFRTFVEVFTDHWLENRTELDIVKFKKVDRGRPYKNETYDYLQFLLLKNRPVNELFVSDYKLLTAPMADFYKMYDSKLDHFKPTYVKAPGKGGLLNQSYFYIARSDGVDPLPFNRAEWVGENALGYTFSEPPGNIDTELFKAQVEELSFKERTLQHAEMKACATCHKKLDPVAFALNKYGTLGDIMSEKTHAPDPAAETFLQKKFSESKEHMAHAFAVNMLSYLIGRDTNIYDLQKVDKILAETGKKGYAVRDIFAGIIREYFKN